MVQVLRRRPRRGPAAPQRRRRWLLFLGGASPHPGLFPGLHFGSNLLRIRRVHTQWELTGIRKCFLPAGEAGAGEAGPLSSAEAGDEQVFARKGRERQLFLWLAKTRKKGKKQG